MGTNVNEDFLLREIFLATIETTNVGSVVCLEGIATMDLKGDEPLLSLPLIDKVLDGLPKYSNRGQLVYLMACYRRAEKQLDNTYLIEDENMRKKMELVCMNAKTLVIKYSRVLWVGDKYWHQRRRSILLDLIYEEVPMGTKFLKDFLALDFGKRDFVLKGLYDQLWCRVIKESVLGDLEPAFKSLKFLLGLDLGVERLLEYYPRDSYEKFPRSMEVNSMLGPFFRISALKDETPFVTGFDIGKECFSKASARPDTEIQSTISKIRSRVSNLQFDLYLLMRFLLLESSDHARQYALQFIADVINRNAAQINIDQGRHVSSGTLINLCDVVTRLCNCSHDTDEITPEYVFSGHRLELSGLTTLSSEKVPVSSDNDATYTLRCELFFMTARLLNLGLLRELHRFQLLSKDISLAQERKAILLSRKDPEFDIPIRKVEEELDLLLQTKYCHEAQIWQETYYIRLALDVYRLVVVWLIKLAGGMPLPEICPVQFSHLPAHFVEDAMVLLSFASTTPGALDDLRLDEFMDFIITFMANSEYVRSEHLRAKMVDVLHIWMLHTWDSSSTTDPFEGDQSSLDYLVKNLMTLYVDVESIVSDKFTIRCNIIELLMHLWKKSKHQNKWREIAKEEKKGLYLKFLNYLINDSIAILDGSLRITRQFWRKNVVIPEEKESEENNDRIHMRQSNAHIDMIAFISEEVTDSFLLPDMVDRVAHMLNYFLAQLLGSISESLLNVNVYEFTPRLLLREIIGIYVNIARADTENIFPSAIASDKLWYKEQLFAKGVDELCEEGWIIREFLALSGKVKASASEALDEEVQLGEIPDEFIDPIQQSLMKHPVKLPSSGKTVDRATIERHLFNRNTDPFNQQPLTLDMLIENMELKLRIDKFLESRPSKKGTSGEGTSTSNK